MNIFIKIYRLISSNKKKFWFLVLFTLVGTAFETLSIGLIFPFSRLISNKGIFTDYLGGFPLPFFSGKNSLEHYLPFFLLSVLAFVFMIKAIYLVFLSWYQSKFAFHAENLISNRLFSYYLNLSYSFHLKVNSAHLVRNVTNEVMIFRDNLMLSIMLVSESLVAIGLMSLLFFIQPVIALIAIFLLFLAFVIFHFFTKKIVDNLGKERQIFDSKNIKIIQESLAGVKEIKIYNKENYFINQHKFNSNRIERIGSIHSTIMQTPRIWIEFFAIFSFTIISIILYLQNISFTEIVPMLSLFSFAALRLLPSANRIIGAFHGIKFGLPVIEKLYNELLNEKLSNSSRQNLKYFSSLELKGLTFAYPLSKKNLFEDLDFRIDQGKVIGITGASGLGKSTLINLLIGLIDPRKGEIYINDHPLGVNITKYNRLFGYVSQAPFIFNASILENICFGIKDKNLPSIRKILKISCLDKFVNSIPNGINSAIDEFGENISGGQRQRIAIARALYTKPKILILDEATNALDKDTENLLFFELKKFEFAKAVLIISHQGDTLKHCDIVYAIKNRKLFRVR